MTATVKAQDSIVSNGTPKRIVCLTEETTEWLYLLGEENRIVGISGFTVRPPQARREKPRVCAFTSARVEKICQLEPDLVLGFSDLQADIAADLVRSGLNVLIFNQRSIEGILGMMWQVAALVGATDRAQAWISGFRKQEAQMTALVEAEAVRPWVYFEEWDDPLISGIQWVGELIEMAGGRDCFPELTSEAMARNRILADAGAVIERNPDIIIGSWCGKKFRPERVVNRPGWHRINAVRNNQLHEIKSPLILQPGPAALTDGLDAIRQCIVRWHQGRRE